MGVAAVAASASARAQVRLGAEAGGNYSVNVMSWWQIPFRTVVRQRYDFSCGSAALATLLTYHYGHPMNERQSFAAMWKAGDQAAIRKQGFSLLDMKTYRGTIGYRAEGFRLNVKDLPKIRRPLVLLLDLRGFKHFVVLKGVAGDQVLVGDPMLGLTKYPMPEFSRYWNGVALAIMRSPGNVAPGFNLASDWQYRGLPAQKRDLATREGIGSLTSYLPPTYQISPVMLLDARVGTVN